MAEFKFLPIPAEEYDALGIGPDTVLETHVTEDGTLIVHALNTEDLGEIICDDMCASCPLVYVDCDEQCRSCPCFANCDNRSCVQPEGGCRSHGTRREF